MEVSSPANKLGRVLFSSSCLAAAMISLSGMSASATTITINTTGTLSGTIELPSFNPNFNNSTTRIDTDENGVYYRDNQAVYDSDYVKSRTNSNGTTSYYVDFKGVPVVSFDGVLTSPVLSDGGLTTYTYQGRLSGVTFQGVIQDEFSLTRAFYTGTVTDPSTGKQYQGTFEISGYGPRYSDSNGGESPTVFDFQSDIPGAPTVTSLTISNVPLRLSIKVEVEDVPEPSVIGATLVFGALASRLKKKNKLNL